MVSDTTAMVDMVLDIPPTDQHTTDMAGTEDMDITERGLPMLNQSQRPMLILGIHMATVLGIDTDMEDMVIMDILHTDLTMVGMDTGEERRGKPSQQPQPTLRPMLSLGTLPMGMGVDTVDIEDMDTMERSNPSVVSRSAFDNSPLTIANFNRYFVPLANMLLGLIICVLGLLGLISFVSLFENK